MNTKGVEDGMSDEQAVRQVYPKAGVGASGAIYLDGICCFTHEKIGNSWADARAKLPKPATPEELTAQAENLNYKPGPRQAVPFMPQPSTAVPVEERTRVLMEALKAVENERLECHDRLIAGYKEADEQRGDEIYSRAIDDAEEAIKALISLSIPEERTAEMEQLMASLRAAAEHGMKSDFRDCYPLALATAPNILKLLDHIEGKAKAESIQEDKK